MPEKFDQNGEWKFEFIPEFADCIARIASGWSRLEYDLNTCIWALADTRPALGACITSQLGSLHSHLNALLSLAKLRQVPSSIIDDLNKFSQAVRDAQDKRNRAIHDIWLKTNGFPNTWVV
jgi:hypothetical protein